MVPHIRSRPRRRLACAAGLALLAALGAARPSPAQSREADDSPATPIPSGAAATVFRRFADRVVKVQVVETGSAAKSELGSGFYVSAAGHVVTNYHVISKIVNHPDRYRGELIERGGATRPIRVLQVDVVHDVAVIRAEVSPASWFTLADVRTVQGERLYSMGHPMDLGLSIVEGTYNGLLEHTLYPKIHFTGSINSGMSGGPTVTEGGEVVGVNVRSAGNQLGFLVPIARAKTLLDAAAAPGFAPPKDFMGEIARQLRENQERYLSGMFGPQSKTVTLGAFTLPTEPAPFFKCWGDARRQKEEPYTVVNHQCSTDDYVYIGGDESSGVVEVEHELVSSTRLNPLRFFSLYQSKLQQGSFAMEGSEEDVTRFKCETRNVRNASVTFRAVLCVRRYKRLPGLYDAVLKAAALGTRSSGVVTTLTLSGVTFENAQRTARRYLERFAWRG